MSLGHERKIGKWKTEAKIGNERRESTWSTGVNYVYLLAPWECEVLGNERRFN